MFAFTCPKCRKAVIKWTGKPVICPNSTCNAPFKTLRREHRRLLLAARKSEEYKEDRKEAFRRYNEESPPIRVPSEVNDQLDLYVDRMKRLGHKTKKRDVLAVAILEYLKKHDLK